MKKQIFLLLALFFMFWIGTVAQAAIIVGRISYVEGGIYRYMDVGKEWEETFVDSPAGTGDILSTGAGSRAEIVFPNSQEVRLAENAELEIIDLTEDIGEFYLVSGLVRFYNNSTASMQIKTSQGVASIPAGSTADLQVKEDSLQIWSVRGGSTFLKQASNRHKETLEVIDQFTNLTISRNSVIASSGPIDMGWHSWCAERENVWQERQLVRSQFMPEPLQVYSYSLKPYGRWRRVYYQGYNYWAWQPRHVAVNWAPYTTGYWHEWHGDRVWVDHNPWGWVTHHHGHWMHVRGSWMWTPYVHVASTPGVTVTSFSVVFGSPYRSHWHPGRVRWIAHNNYVGWLPLAPWETYYGRRSWGPRSVVMHDRSGVNISININLGNHHYLDHAVVIPGKHFKRRGPTVIKNYRTVKIKNINKKVIVKNYRPVPILTERQFKKREQVAKPHTKPGTKVVYRDRKVDRKKVVKRGKENRKKKPGPPVLAKMKPREKTEIFTFENRKATSQRITTNKKVSNKKKIATSRSKVQGERVSFLEIKDKRNTSKRNIRQIKTKYKKQTGSAERYQIVRPQKTTKRQQKQELKKGQQRKKANEEYAEQEKPRRNKRFNFNRQQENRSLRDQKTAGRRERYSMNRSGSASLSSLSNRRGRF
jgi:hypothetical protein